MKNLRQILIGIYFHPEAYPPTLNAIGELADCFEKVDVIHRPHLKGSWQYPSNVKTKAPGDFISSAEQERASLPRKIGFYLQFLWGFFTLCITRKPEVILVYDGMSMLAYHLVRPFLFFRHKIWYHNHDVIEPKLLRKFSIGWFAEKAEKTAFRYLDFFSLPSKERLQYFPMDVFKGVFFYIPNYPAVRFYQSFYKKRELTQPLKLIFQGSIGPYHGIEEIIPMLKVPIRGYTLNLVLKGFCDPEYKSQCEAKAAALGVSDQLIFKGLTPYKEVPQVSSECHIGIAILAKQDLMNKTLGTASNKIYEYAAVGLPVIYYNSSDFVTHLGRFSWAIPADLTGESIQKAIETIIAGYTTLSEAANADFRKNLNFEAGFSEVVSALRNIGT